MSESESINWKCFWLEMEHHSKLRDSSKCGHRCCVGHLFERFMAVEYMVLHIQHSDARIPASKDNVIPCLICFLVEKESDTVEPNVGKDQKSRVCGFRFVTSLRCSRSYVEVDEFEALFINASNDISNIWSSSKLEMIIEETLQIKKNDKNCCSKWYFERTSQNIFEDTFGG